MIYTSIDIETTGLDLENDQILSIGLAIEDTNRIAPISEIPTLHIIILRKRISGSPFALNLNKNIINAISDYQRSDDINKRAISNALDTIFLEEDKVVEEIHKFFWKHHIRFDSYETYNGPFHKGPSDEEGTPLLTSSIPKVHFNVAGKNFASFDKIFLERLPRWKQVFKIRTRILDPAILFLEWDTDDQVPGLDLCMLRANVEGAVTHNALQDAIDVIRVLRKTYFRDL